MKKLFFVLAAVIFSSRLLAQDTTHRSLDEVVLSASKYARKQSETGKVVTVITREQLDQSGARGLGELLNGIAGTIVTGANNNAGTNQTISIRGGSAGNVLLLVDGIPVNDPSVITNYFDLNFIHPSQVERIEILKGGQSTLYGSDAVSGVVNIITRKATSQSVQLNGQFSGGSYNSLQESLGVSLNGKKADFTVQYAHTSSDGFSSAKDTTGSGNFDRDGFDQHALNGRFSVKLTPALQMVLTARYNKYKTDVDAAAYTDDRDFTATNENIQAGGGWMYALKKGKVQLNYLYNQANRNYLDDSVSKGNPFSYFSNGGYTGITHYAELYTNQQWKNWELVAGSDIRLNKTVQNYYSTGMFGPYTAPELSADMNQFTVYASLVYKNKSGWNVEGGGRWNKHSAYGDNFSFTFNPSYQVSRKVKTYVNLYSAYKVPTLYQLYDPFAGNKTLQPEKALVGEAGVSITPTTSLNIRLTGFYSRTKNIILYTYDPMNFTSLYQNASLQKNHGAELEWTYRKKSWQFSGNYTFTDGKTTAGFDGTGTPTGKDTSYFNLYHIPKHAVNLELGYQFTKALLIKTSIRSVSKREEFVYGSSPENLKRYTTVDLYAEYKLGKAFRFFADFRNLGDAKYMDVLGYNTRGMNVAGGVRFEF